MVAGYFHIVESGLPSAWENDFLLCPSFLLLCYSYVLSSEIFIFISYIFFYFISYIFAPLVNILFFVSFSFKIPISLNTVFINISVFL